MFYENESHSFTESMGSSVKTPKNIFILLGPEGGFSDKEVDMARSGGFIIASLGPRVLRAETASISACTLVQHMFGDMV